MKRGNKAPQHPKHEGKATGPSHEATRPPEGGTSTVTGPGRRKGTTEGGEGDNSQRGRGATTQHNKNSKQGSPATPKAAHKGLREDNRKTTGRKTNRKKRHRGATAREEPRKRPKTKQRARKARPKTIQKRGPGGGQDHEKASKRPPQSNSKWEQITKRCQGTSGTGDRTGVKRTRQVKGRGDEKEGGRYVIPRVVYSSNVVCQLGECHSSCSRLQRRQDPASPVLRHGAAVHCI